MRLKTLVAGLLFASFLANPSFGEDKKSYFRDIVIEKGETVEGDVVCCFCSVAVRGEVSDEVVTLWGGLEVQGSVYGDAVAVGGAIRVQPGGKVGGDAVAVGGAVTVESGGTVNEEVVSKTWFHLPGQKQVFWRGGVACLAFLVVWAFLSLALQGARRVYVQAEYLTAHPWRSLLLGTVLLAAIIAGLAYSELAGEYEDYVESALLILWALLFLLGFAGLCARLSRFLSTDNMLVLTVVGSALVLVLSLIPYLGLVLFLVFLCMAMGTPFFTRFRPAL